MNNQPFKSNGPCCDEPVSPPLQLRDRLELLLKMQSEAFDNIDKLVFGIEGAQNIQTSDIGVDGFNLTSQIEALLGRQKMMNEITIQIRG